MIPLGLTKEQYILLAQRLATQIRLKDEYVMLEIKPARKGEIFGKGGKGKKPKFEIRIKATFTDAFKEMIVQESKKVI